METVLITGANRGIGLEFVRQYVADGTRIIATCRNPDGAEDLKAIAGDVTIFPLEVTDPDSIQALAASLGDQPIDILVNNAGVYGKKAFLGNIDYDNWLEVMAVNTLAPMRIAEALLDHVSRSRRKVMAMITSKMGSIADNSGGGSYIYRSSKAALNAAVKSLSVDTMNKGMTCVVLHPGWVQTDMGGPNALITPTQSVSGMRRVLADLTQADSGRFLNYDGSDIPW
ncbi:MAG: SDR family oxidoreductase [Acidobacteriota bacterium]|nr:SDR family oxidoreductase [Acidobacteriota bacterium]